MENKQETTQKPQQLNNQPLINIGDLFKGAWTIYKERFGTLIGITVVPFIGFFVSGLLALTASFFETGITSSVLWLLTAIVVVVSILLAIESYIALVYALDNKELNVRSAYRATKGKLFKYAWIAILISIITIGGFVLGIIPGAVFGIWFAFSIYALLLEDEKGLKALMKSKEYVRGNWWQVFWRFLLIGAALIVLSIIVGTIFGIISEELASIINQILQIFITPFSVAYVFLLYKNIKSIKPNITIEPSYQKRGVFIAIGVLGLIAIPVAIYVSILFAPADQKEESTNIYAPEDLFEIPDYLEEEIPLS